MTAGHLIFVYGSLLSGEANHPVMVRCGARLEGAARTAAGFSLYDLGTYPALAREGVTEVVGELYVLPDETLPMLDAFEGHPHLYRREEIALGDGRRAEAYLWTRDSFLESLATRRRLESGDWRRREEERAAR